MSSPDTEPLSPQPPVFEWERIHRNSDGVPLPWPVAQTDAESVWSVVGDRGVSLWWLSPIIFSAYRDAFGESNEPLLWSGISAGEAVSRASFDDRRETFAITETDEQATDFTRFALYSHGTVSRPPEDLPAILVMRASAMQLEVDWGYEYLLRPEVQHFDEAVAGLLLLGKIAVLDPTADKDITKGG